MTEQSDSSAFSAFDLSDHQIGILLGLLVSLMSLFTAVIGAHGLDPITGAAWAWAIGMGTVLWVVPWVKKGVKAEATDASS